MGVTKRKTLSRLTKAFLETAEGMHSIGLMDDATYRQITVRHLGPQAPPTAKPISARKIRSMREEANLSQAAFARYLNLTPGYISQLEPGARSTQRHSQQGLRGHPLAIALYA
jgi:putative transcriptional regulator